MPSSTSGRPAWLSTSAPNGGIKLKLDMVIGSHEIESTDKNTITDITSRVKDLNNRLNDIRREQIFQRVRQDSTIGHDIMECKLTWML